MSEIQISLWENSRSVNDLVAELVDRGIHHAVFHELVKALILQEAFDEYNIDIDRSPELVKSLVADFCRSQKFDADQGLMLYLSKTRQTQDELEDKLVFHHQIEELKKIAVDEAQVREAFLQRKSLLDQVSFQLIRTETAEQASAIYDELKNGDADFAAMASKHSTGKEAANGGQVGPAPMGALNPKLLNELGRLQTGEFSQPFQMDEKVHMIVRLVRHNPAELTPVLEKSLRDELFDGWVQKKKILGQARIAVTQA